MNADRDRKVAHTFRYSQGAHLFGRWLIFLGVTPLVGVIVLTVAFASEFGVAITRNTIRLSLAWYVLALCLMMRLKRHDWFATTRLGRLTRGCWSWAWLCFVVHVAVAFHYYHHWSHAEAFEHTRRVAGIGEGLYVSYLFTLLWTIDVALWWLRPARYAARSPWIDRTLHGFMLFLVFNSMVVFETGFIRWAGITMFAVLGLLWLMTRSVAALRFR